MPFSNPPDFMRKNIRAAAATRSFLTCFSCLINPPCLLSVVPKEIFREAWERPAYLLRSFWGNNSATSATHMHVPLGGRKVIRDQNSVHAIYHNILQAPAAVLAKHSACSPGPRNFALFKAVLLLLHASDRPIGRCRTPRSSLSLSRIFLRFSVAFISTLDLPETSPANKDDQKSNRAQPRGPKGSCQESATVVSSRADQSPGWVAPSAEALRTKVAAILVSITPPHP